MNLTEPQQLISQGQPAQAVDALSSLLLTHPDHAPTHLFLGIALWDSGDPVQATAAFDRVLERQPKNDLARSYRALCLLATGQGEAATQIWKNSGFNDNAMFRVRLVEFIEQAWLETGAFMGESSPPAADSADGDPQPLHPAETSTLPPNGRALSRRALKYYYARNFTKLAALMPPPPLADELQVFLAGTAHEMLRQYAAARSYLEPLRPLRDQWPEPIIALGARLDLRAGKIASAARDFAGILVVGPEDFGINYHMGIVALAYEKRELARSYFLRALTSYMVDTLDFQWTQLTTAIFDHPTTPSPTSP